MTITYEITIADLLTSIAALIAVPAAIWSIVSLFRKDKEKVEQIQTLTQIANSQNQQVQILSNQASELSKQTLQFEFQTELLRESNAILRDQISLQNEANVSDQKYKDEYLKLEQRKRRNEIKPFFKQNGSRSSGNAVTLLLINFGERAYYHGITLDDAENIDISPQSQNQKVIEKNQELQINFTYKNPNRNVNNRTTSTFSIEIKDEDQNSYKQTIGVIGDRFSVTTPQLVD